MSYFKNIQQNVVADPNNSSTVNLAAGDTFTGVGTSTLGIVGIQISIKTDQNCTVYCDQSPDGTNWDITDTFTYLYTFGGDGWTVQAVNSYVRLRVKNTSGSATTYFRLQLALCPIVEAVPRTLDGHGDFKTVTHIEDISGFDIMATPMGEMRTVTPVRLVGASFVGTTFDPNFWNSSTANGGSVAQTGGQLILSTNTTTPNGSCIVYSHVRGRYLAGSALRYRAIAQFGDTGAVNNKRRFGVADGTTMPTITNGAWFQIDGTTPSIVTMKGGVETKVDNGSFNGDSGSTIVLNTNATSFEIYWVNRSVYFVINGILLHTVNALTTSWSETNTFYLYMDTVNSGGLATNHTLTFRSATIYRLGQEHSTPRYRRISTATTTVCKYGAGTLHTILINNPTNNVITVYDSTAATAGTQIAVIDPDNGNTPFQLTYDVPFSTGLTIVTAGTADLTIIYE